MAGFQPWERSVMPQGGVRGYTGTSAGEIIGQSVEQAGQALGSAASDLARADLIVNKRNDDAWLGQQKPQAMLDLDKQIQALPDDPASGNYTGAVTKLIDDYTGTLAKAAPSAGAKAEATAYMTDLKAGYLRTANRTVAEAQQVQRIANIDASNQKSAAVLVTSPSRHDQIVAQQEELIRGQGLKQPQEDEQVRKMKVGMAAFAMNGMADQNPRQFLKDLPSWGEKGADPADMAQAQHYAQGLIKQQDADAKQKQREAVADYTSGLDDYTAALADGNAKPNPMYSPEKIRATVGGDRGDKMARTVEAATAIGNIATDVKTATPDQLATMDAQYTTSLKAADTTGYQIKAKQYDIFRDQVTKRNQQIAADPAGYSATAFTSVTNSMNAFDTTLRDPKATPEMKQAAAQQYVTATQTAQTSLGVPTDQQRLLTDGLKNQIVGMLTGPNSQPGSEGALATITTLSQAFGPEWPRVSGEIGKDLPPVMPVVVAMDSPAQANDQGFVLDANQNSGEIKKLAAANGVTPDSVDTAVSEALHDASVTFLDPAIKGGATTYAKMFDAAKDTTYALMLQANSTDPKAFAKRAADMVFGKKYQTADRLRFPTDLDPDAVLGGARMIQSGIGGLNIDAPVSLAGLSTDDARAAYANSVKNDGYWVTSQDESGAVLVDAHGLPVTIGGKPLTMSWDVLTKSNVPAVQTPAGNVQEQTKDPATLPSAGITTMLSLTPKEQFLYQWHVNNITGRNGGKAVKNEDGSTSTVLQRVVDGPGGKFYNVPSVWDGKIHGEAESRKHAAEVGWEKWPSYATPEEADARYEKMHAFIEKDVP